MIATIVDTEALWETVVAAFVAGVGTTIVFSLAILGATRFAEANREGNGFARDDLRARCRSSACSRPPPRSPVGGDRDDDASSRRA